MRKREGDKLDIALIGTGISGLSAAWLLSPRHNVTVYEKAPRLGGHSNTIDVADGARTLPVDMGFIVYNADTYPNLVALFRHFAVPTQPSDMSFTVSLRGGAMEYAGTDLRGLFAQGSNLGRARFWAMLRDLVRFYRQGARDAREAPPAADVSLGDYLAANGYGEAFVRDHLLPMAAAIWSADAQAVLDHPAAAFLRFCDNHGLLRLTGRPIWRTVTGGARVYVDRLAAAIGGSVRLGCGARAISRGPDGVEVLDTSGERRRYDHAVIAAHADQALRLLTDPSDAEASILGAMRYARNEAVMHRDPALMPRRRKVWCSWNYVGAECGTKVSTTYWMNRLQGIQSPPIFVTLNPHRAPAASAVIRDEVFHHPQFDTAAMRAQRELWSIQGVRRTWYCGAYAGAGFHEDGLQSGLAVAEALGGVHRPWTVPNESGRIFVPPATMHVAA